jgi:hypothetical protein
VFCTEKAREMLENTWREIEYRFDLVLATKGAHVEIFTILRIDSTSIKIL